MAGFGALAHLDLDHPHLRILCLFGEALWVEPAVFGAAAKVAAAQFPGQVTAIFSVVRADAAFASVVGEVAQLGALVQRTNRIGAERAEAHRRNVEDRSRIRLRALRPAHGDAKQVRVGQRRRAHGMADELEAGLIDIDQRAERFVCRFILGPCVDQRALGAGKGQGVAVGLKQVLANFRANGFDGVADIAQDRVVATHRMRDLDQVENADQAEDRGSEGERPEPFVREERQAQ